MRNIIFSITVAVGLLGMIGGHALAAKPVEHACMGQSVSAGAQAIHPFGGFVSTVARDREMSPAPGVGGDVQAIQAGQIPDEGFDNTCNDGVD